MPLQQIGRYQIVERLGRGAMGVVYRALDPRIGRSVAVKSIRLGEISDASELKRLRDRLEREARSAGALSHRNIVTIYDIVEDQTLVHLFMEYVNGPSLEKILSERRLPGKPELLEFLSQIANALDYAHRSGIVHRDVKPSNLMIHFERGSNEQVAKITDFGVAKFISQQMTQVGSMMGTPNYMAPEQIEGNQIVGQTDQFALAAVTYEVLTGEKPFVADYIPTLFFRIVREAPQPAHQINELLTPDIDAVLQRGLAKSPGERFETCSDFMSALIDACDRHPEWAPPYPIGTIEPPPVEELEAEPAAQAQAQSSRIQGAAFGLDTPPTSPRAIPSEPPVASSPTPPPVLPVTPTPVPPPAPPPAAPPPPRAESPKVPYEIPPYRRRDWEQEQEPATPLWQKFALALIVLILATAAYIAYRNYFPENETVAGTGSAPVQTPESAPAQGASPSAAAPPPAGGAAASPDRSNRQPDGRPQNQARPNTPQTNTARREQAPAPAPPPAASTQAPNARDDSSAPPPAAEDDQQRQAAPSSKPRPAPAYPADVEFRSQPVPGTVEVDHDPSKTCTTPCQVQLSPGRHTLTVTAPNYGIARRIIQVPEQRSVFVPLTQNIGTVQVDSIPSGSTVYVDGRLVGTTPSTLRINAGPHQVRLVAGGRSHQETIEVSADSLQQFTFRWQ